MAHLSPNQGTCSTSNWRCRRTLISSYYWVLEIKKRFPFEQGRTSTPDLFGLEVLSYIEAANDGKLAGIETLDDNQFIYVENEFNATHSPYSMLLKSAKFGAKG